jgi:hypothetical protein
VTREPIYAAAYAFFAGLTAGGSPLFKTATRKGADWEKVAAEDSPALLFVQRDELAERKKGLPTKWTLKPELLVFVHTGAQTDPSVIPSQIINPLLDAIEASLTVDDPFNNACTLGGLVSHCAINGVIEIVEGSLGDEAVVRIPLDILTSP